MIPGAHILAGFTLGFRYRKQLAAIIRQTPLGHTLLNFDPTALASEGVAVLALDFDGVLAPHGQTEPLPEMQEWLSACAAVFGEARMVVLSNKPTDERRAWFARHHPGMRFISGVRKKPYPDGLNKTGELCGVPLSSVMMVDDRLLTGCLAALIAGCRPCYIRKPYISLRQRPLAESFFALLRRIERLYIRTLCP